MNKKITDILRIIMSILLLITVVLTLIQFSMSALWIGLVLLLLIGNVEITAFKNHKGDRKGVTILNLMTIMATVIYILLVIFALR